MYPTGTEVGCKGGRCIGTMIILGAERFDANVVGRFLCQSGQLVRIRIHIHNRPFRSIAWLVLYRPSGLIRTGSPSNLSRACRNVRNIQTGRHRTRLCCRKVELFAVDSAIFAAPSPRLECIPRLRCKSGNLVRSSACIIIPYHFVINVFAYLDVVDIQVEHIVIHMVEGDIDLLSCISAEVDDHIFPHFRIRSRSQRPQYISEASYRIIRCRKQHFVTIRITCIRCKYPVA